MQYWLLCLASSNYEGEDDPHRKLIEYSNIYQPNAQVFRLTNQLH